MTHLSLSRSAAVVAAAFALAACGGALPPASGGAGPPAAANLDKSPRPVRKKVKVRIHVRFPKPPRRHARRALLRQYSIASETQGIETLVYAAGTQTLLQSSAADISQSSAGCTASGTGRVCTFAIAAPPGNDDFVFKTYDEKPVGGSIPSGAGELGAGVANQDVAEGAAAPAIAVTLGGVLSSIGIAVTPVAIHTLIETTATLQVFAEDADGGAIIGSYVDANGNALSISLSASNAGCCPALTFTPASLSSPSPTGVQIAYNGNLTNQGGNQTITATPSGGSASAATTNFNVVDPTFDHVNDSNLSAQGPFFAGAAYANGNVFYTYNSSNGGIDYYTISNHVLGNVAGVSSDPVSGGLVYAGAFGNNLYVAGPNNLYTTDVLSPAGNPTPTSCGTSCGGSGSGMAVDASGDVWYGDGTNLVEYNGSGVQSFAIGGTPIFGMAFDQSSNLWMANGSAGADVIYFNTGEESATTYPMPSSNARPFDVIADSNGMIWVTDRGANQIVEINPSTLSSNVYYVPYGTPWYIVQDPIQTTTYWYNFQNGSSVGVGRLDTLTGQMTQALDYGLCCAQPGAIVEQNGLIFFPVDGAQTLDVVSP